MTKQEMVNRIETLTEMMEASKNDKYCEAMGYDKDTRNKEIMRDIMAQRINNHYAVWFAVSKQYASNTNDDIIMSFVLTRWNKEKLEEILVATEMVFESEGF